MVKQANPNQFFKISAILRGVIPLTFLFLLIEFFDELNYGIGNAALPAIRADLGISYVQVGLLLGLPGIINTAIEPLLMLIGDTRYRKHIILGGGVAIILSLAAIAGTHSFIVVLLAMIIGYPASGAFVSLSQATLMDLNPGREPQMMARWTVSGSVANLIGPLLLAGGFSLGWGWRWAYVALAAFCIILVALTWRQDIPAGPKLQPPPSEQTVKSLLVGLWAAIRNPRLMRWLILLPFSDLLLDVLTGYLPLYFTDVSGLSVAQASLVMSVLMAASLVSNIALVPLLERFPGLKLVRASAWVSGVLYTAWLLAPWLWVKIALIVLIKLTSLGWYEVLQGEAFASVPGRSGTVMAVNSLIGPLAGVISFLVGLLASRAGLPAAMWILLLGPLILVLFVPRVRPVAKGD